MTRIRTLVHYTNPPALAGGCSVIHGDPADRLIAATALVHRAALITADEKLRAIPKLQWIW